MLQAGITHPVEMNLLRTIIALVKRNKLVHYNML